MALRIVINQQDLGSTVGQSRRAQRARGASRRPRRTATEWQALILQQAESGLSAKAFCDQHDITYSSFMNWRRRLGDNSSPESGDDSLPMFVELTKPSGHADPQRDWLIELDLGAGIQLRIARPD